MTGGTGSSIVMPVNRLWIATGFASLLLACGVPVQAAPAARVLDRQVAVELAARADEAQASALACTPIQDLGVVFVGAALRQARGRAASFAQRGFRLEERSVSRTFVAWDPRAPAVVLQVEAQNRLVTADQPDPVWSATVRQVWSRFQFAAGRWRVAETHDLSPDRWLTA